MLILLPVLVCVIVSLMVFGILSKKEPLEDAIRATVIYSMGAVSLFTIICSELLGALSIMTRPALVILWSVTLLVLISITWRKRIFIDAIKPIAAWWNNIKLNKTEWFVLLATGFYLITLFIIAFISPPNNNDSLQYHVARIVHWIQNQNFEFFTTAYLPQLFNPPGAEILLLHNFLLVGSDKLVNLQQWVFMLSSLVVASLIAKKLGSGRTGQWLAAVFLLCLPMGILEATSTQNDYVATFWILSLVYLVIKNLGQVPSILEMVVMGAFAGLAMLTRITTYPYVAIILIWSTLAGLKQVRLKRSILNTTIIICVITVINTQFWVQNYNTFNNPLGEMSFVGRRSLNTHTAADLIISPVQHLSLNLGTPFNTINTKLGNAIISSCEKLGGSNCSDPESSEWDFRIIGLSNHEDTAGNLLHLVVLFLAVIVFIFERRQIDKKVLVTSYLLVIIACFLLLSWLIPWAIYYSRFQLPMFAMMASFVGLIVSRRNARIIRALIIILLICGLPWLLMNRTRPVISYPPDLTLVRSIFIESRAGLLFANYPELEDQIQHVTGEALKTGCPDILLRIDSRDPEYYFMSYLQPWKNDIWVESVADNLLLDRYMNTNFNACALICSICGFDPDSHGLIFAYKDKAMTLYLSPEYYAEFKNR